MKKLLWCLLFITFLSCQKEEFSVTESQEETVSFTQDRQLASLIQSVSSHDGAFDNIVDDADCFSINYPYLCNANGEQYIVNSASDLDPFSMYDKLIPEFPITITFANHIEAEVSNYNTFIQLIEQCQNGELFNQIIRCVDFNYPISVAIFNTDTESFETMVFNHDRDTFTSLELIDENTLATVNYPIQLTTSTNLVLNIESNEQLKEEILVLLPLCE